MKSDNRPIGIFDSGVGGLSVLLEIKKLLPLESSVFLADQAHNPYGAKTKKQLQNLSLRITKFLLKHNIKLLVVACNTATCYAIDYLRQNFTIPIIGVVPAIKPASTFTKAGKIVIMSTPATAKSTYLKKMIDKYANGAKVLKLGCDQLEESIECLDKQKINKLLNLYSRDINHFGADVVVLGCTHFPFIKNDLAKKINSAKIIDSGGAVAKRVKTVLSNTFSLAATKAQDLYYTTADPINFTEVASILLGRKISAQKVNI